MGHIGVVSLPRVLVPYTISSQCVCSIVGRCQDANLPPAKTLGNDRLHIFHHEEQRESCNRHQAARPRYIAAANSIWLILITCRNVGGVAAIWKSRAGVILRAQPTLQRFSGGCLFHMLLVGAYESTVFGKEVSIQAGQTSLL